LNYNLLITAILIVAFLFCYKIMRVSKEEYMNYIDELKLEVSDMTSKIETLRSESLESYRKGLYDGLEVKKDNILVVEPKPIKTFIEREEEIINKQAFEKNQNEKTTVDEFGISWNGR